MFERFTDRSQRALEFAQEEARLLQHDHTGTEHLLLGLLREEEGDRQAILTSLGVTVDGARDAILERRPRGESLSEDDPPFTAGLKQTLELALLESIHLPGESIRCEQLLIGLLRNYECVGTQVLVGQIGDLNPVVDLLVERMSWYTGRSIERDGRREPIMERPDIRPLAAGQTGHARPKPTRPPSSTPQPQRTQLKRPDFERLAADWVGVFDGGLPPQPDDLQHSDAIPVSYWTTDRCGAVQFIFFFEDHEGALRPGDVTLQYNRDEDGWHPVKTQVFVNGNRTGAIGDPNFMRQHPHQAIEVSGSTVTTEPEPGRLAVVMSGYLAPEVAEIWLVQGGRTEIRPASGHFGSWTVCSEVFAPLRVEAHDAAGVLLGVAQLPMRLEAAFDEQPFDRVAVHEVDQPHHYGGRVEVQEIERHTAKAVVKWLITLEPDPDLQLAEDLVAHGEGSEDPWSIERIADHVKLIDVLKLTVFFSQISLTDNLGTEYRAGGGGRSTGPTESSCSQTFEPAIPQEATLVTVHWEDLDFRVPLH